MVDRNLVRYVRAVIEANGSLEHMIQNLTTVGGWQRVHVDQAIAEAYAELKRIEELKKSALEFQNNTQTTSARYTIQNNVAGYVPVQVSTVQKHRYSSSISKPIFVGIFLFLFFTVLSIWLLNKAI